MAPILGYWSLRGLAQPIRYLLEFTGTEYEEKLYDIGGPPDYDSSQWTSVKETLGLKFPNLPYYIDGDLKMTESGAILKHLARKNNMAGSTEEDFITLDVASGIIHDQFIRFAMLVYNDDFEKSKGAYFENINTLLKKLADLVGSQDYILGDKITYVDFQVIEILDRYEALVPNCLSGFPVLQAYEQRIKNLPAIKKYLASPVFLKMKDRFHGRSAKFGSGTY